MAHGSFCHVELSTTDLKMSREFYETLFGWTFQTFPGMGTYAMFATPEGLGGGFDAGPNADPPTDKGPVLHIEVDDIDEILKRIEKAGGRIVVPKTKISDEFGFFGIFIDNVGNRLGVWSKT